MKKRFYKKTQEGYAILFTVVIMGIILSIAVGLSNSTYKQLLLSSVARDSQTAFYESDTATECALYATIDTSTFTTSGSSSYSCSVDANGNARQLTVTKVVSGSNEQYTAVPTSGWSTSTDPCFELDVTRDPTQTPSLTTTAKGYNICNKNNQRAVEREIFITYY